WKPVEDPVFRALGDGLIVGRAGILNQSAEYAASRLPLGRRVHARHRDETAERQSLEPVFRLADALRPDTRAESDHVLPHTHAEQLRRDEMTDLMQPDREAEAEQHEQDADDVEQDFHTPTLLRAH